MFDVNLAREGNLVLKRIVQMSNKNFVLGLATLALSIANVPNAQAVVIFDNGYAANNANYSGPSDFAYPQQFANDFIVNGTFNEIQWYGGSITPWTNPDNFTIRKMGKHG
jgi:hypothetical protein